MIAAKAAPTEEQPVSGKSFGLKNFHTAIHPIQREQSHQTRQ
jgi:hypothetical protein